MEKKISWMVACVSEFARSHAVSVKTAFQFLFRYGGIQFLEEYYEAEHLLSFEDTMEDLIRVCENSGGVL